MFDGVTELFCDPPNEKGMVAGAAALAGGGFAICAGIAGLDGAGAGLDADRCVCGAGRAFLIAACDGFGGAWVR